MIAAPLCGIRGVVRPEWVSPGTSHLNLSYYGVIFDAGSDALFDALDIGLAYHARTGQYAYCVEAHIVYEHEMLLGEEALVKTTLLDADAKRLHFAHEMFRPDGGPRASLQELLYVSVDTRISRAAPWTGDAWTRIEAGLAAHAALPRPAKLGRAITLRR